MSICLPIYLKLHGNEVLRCRKKEIINTIEKIVTGSPICERIHPGSKSVSGRGMWKTPKLRFLECTQGISVVDGSQWAQENLHRALGSYRKCCRGRTERQGWAVRAPGRVQTQGNGIILLSHPSLIPRQNRGKAGHRQGKTEISFL